MVNFRQAYYLLFFLRLMSLSLDSIYQQIPTGEGELPDWQHLLRTVLETFDCTTGTIHVLDPVKNLLILKAYQGIPEFLLPKMNEIPIGKGMAGIAAQRKQPVQICNLQTDESGVARPSAKETKVEGSMTAPMLYQDRLCGTLGIAKPVPYEFTPGEESALMEVGRRIAEKLTP